MRIEGPFRLNARRWALPGPNASPQYPLFPAPFQNGRPRKKSAKTFFVISARRTGINCSRNPFFSMTYGRSGHRSGIHRNDAFLRVHQFSSAEFIQKKIIKCGGFHSKSVWFMVFKKDLSACEFNTMHYFDPATFP